VESEFDGTQPAPPLDHVAIVIVVPTSRFGSIARTFLRGAATRLRNRNCNQGAQLPDVAADAVYRPLHCTELPYRS